LWLLQDPRLKPLQAFWQELVVYLQQQLSGAKGRAVAASVATHTQQLGIIMLLLPTGSHAPCCV
jgi:hypothetical protein